MLNFSTGVTRTCDGRSRRDFLRIGALSGLAVSLPSVLASNQARANTSQPTRPATEVNCILVWTHGGTSHHDTLDPKPLAPVSVRGEFGAIATAVPGVQFSEICPRLARELGRFAVLRGWNPDNGSHGLADIWMMSGRRYNPALAYPCFGSVVSHQRGFKSALPPFVQLGNFLDRRFGGGSAGYLGLAHNPFELLADPSADAFHVRDISLPGGVDLARIDRRRTMLARLDSLERQIDLQPKAFAALDEHYRAALNMVTAPATKRAFEIGHEDPRLRDRYGRTRFGQSLLLARRLIEAGVRFVTVTDSGWDTHQDNFRALKNGRMPPVDQALPELLVDLDERGMLASTLVVWLTDFGRTPNVNSASGRDHWAGTGFAVMAGAGIPGGAVLGATDDEGGRVVRDEYFSEDIAATIYTKLGIPLELITYSSDGRPVRLNEGRPIKEWL